MVSRQRSWPTMVEGFLASDAAIEPSLHERGTCFKRGRRVATATLADKDSLTGHSCAQSSENCGSLLPSSVGTPLNGATERLQVLPETPAGGAPSQEKHHFGGPAEIRFLTQGDDRLVWNWNISRRRLGGRVMSARWEWIIRGAYSPRLFDADPGGPALRCSSIRAIGMSGPSPQVSSSLCAPGLSCMSGRPPPLGHPSGLHRSGRTTSPRSRPRCHRSPLLYRLRRRLQRSRRLQPPHRPRVRHRLPPL